MYELCVAYTTGDSFGSHAVEKDELGIVFATKDLAVRGLKDLEEHYRYVELYDEAYYENSPLSKGYPEDKTKEQIRVEALTKAWSYFENTYSDSWQFSMSFETGLTDGRTFISLPYIGYFETLKRAWVEEVNTPLEVRF
jgi:hypothetical protein